MDEAGPIFLVILIIVAFFALVGTAAAHTPPSPSPTPCPQVKIKQIITGDHDGLIYQTEDNKYVYKYLDTYTGDGGIKQIGESVCVIDGKIQ
jgi:hypothetical protein